MNKKYLIVLIILCISSSSCLKIYFRIYGIKKNKEVNFSIIDKFLKKNNVPNNLILELDSQKYAKLISLKEIDTINYQYAKWWTQNHIQPIQALYYDTDSNKFVAAFFNCISETKGISNMTWNKERELEVFPPYAYQKWTDSLFSFNEIISTVNDLKINSTFEPKTTKKRYVILLFYSIFIEKQSLNMFKEVQYNLRKEKIDNYHLLYINMDNYFYSQLKK